MLARAKVRGSREFNKIKRYRPGDMFTEPEVKELINSCNNPRDKAIIAILYDCGLRPHELTNMRISDVSLGESGADITVPEDSKTGARTIPLIFSFTYVRDWLNNHPLKNNQEAYICIRNRGIFRSENSLKNYKPHMTEMALYMIFWELKKQLSHKLHKRFWHPYILRHTAISNWANILPEAQVKYLAGWTPESPMTRVYVHISGIEAKKALLKHYGKITMEEPTQPINKQCPRCEYVNQPTNKQCDKCSFPLSVEGYEEQKQKEQSLQDKLERISLFTDLITPLLTSKNKHIILTDPQGNELAKINLDESNPSVL